jgi:hypothetical protein
MLIGGYEHQHARIAESILAGVLIAAAAFTRMVPAWTRRAGLFAQAFARSGTLTGVFAISVGVGPRTLPDIDHST